ncbi:MAG TPA: DUF2760 domain-containing protein, partial [Anaeromyxobacteraceae bacterium]
MNGNLTPLQRFFLAFVAFFYVLANRRFAEEVRQVRERQRAALPPASTPPAVPSSTATPTPPATPTPTATTTPTPIATPTAISTATPGPPGHAESLHLLSLLQRDGRLLDFLSESLEGFSDSEIGAAARTVHEGCNKTLTSYLALEPVFREPEGAAVTVAAGFDAAA